ncbi:MAG: hypothetical protein KF826_03885 [Xanthobacteraceae bacterium]|nr:hypothetical protein [Xanthobacteraceae bacterium]MBX3533469.1 hypothetical protein [Xanthobacteraceae bacterium]MCW5676409.1 hypothetical protein [Xanthobacteraceae bacterium]
MALISDGIHWTEGSPKVRFEIIDVVRMMQEECFETADYDFCENVMLDWLLAICAVDEVEKKKGLTYKFNKGCSGGQLFRPLPGLYFYIPGNVDEAKVDETLLMFLRVRAHSFRLKHPWDYATEGWVLWAVLTEMVKQGDVTVKIRNRKMKLTLAPGYLAEVRTLASI